MSIWCILLPVLTGLILFKKLYKEGILIILLVTTGSIPQLIRGILGRKDFIYFFYNINIPLELTLLYFFFKGYLKTNTRSKVLNFSFYLSLVVGLLLTLHYQFQYRFLNEWVCLNNLLFTGWILMLLLEIYESDDFQLNARTPLFWFIIGLFLYSSCTAIIFSLWNYIRSNENSMLNNLWIIHDVFNVTMYLVFSYGLLQYRRTNFKPL